MAGRSKEEINRERQRLLAKFSEWGLSPPPNPDLHPDVLMHILYYARREQRRGWERVKVCREEYDAAATRHYGPTAMSGARHRQKGDRIERELVAMHRALGLHCERVPLSGATQRGHRHLRQR
jgi:hypothetical protein